MSAKILTLVVPTTPMEQARIQGKASAAEYFWTWRKAGFHVSYPRAVDSGFSPDLNRVYYDYAVDWLADCDEVHKLIGRRLWLAQQESKESGK